MLVNVCLDFEIGPLRSCTDQAEREDYFGLPGNAL